MFDDWTYEPENQERFIIKIDIILNIYKEKYDIIFDHINFVMIVITGRFNVLMVCEVLTIKNVTRKNTNKVKNIITLTKQVIEYKVIDFIEIDDYNYFIQFTNHKPNDVFKCNHEFVEYFDKLLQDMVVEGFYEHLLVVLIDIPF